MSAVLIEGASFPSCCGEDAVLALVVGMAATQGCEDDDDRIQRLKRRSEKDKENYKISCEPLSTWSIHDLPIILET